MTGTRTALSHRVLIPGASIALRLHRYADAVPVVEKADALRNGGCPIDVRGTALDVVRRTGILSRVRDAHIDLRRLTFHDEDGSEVVPLDPHAVTGVSRNGVRRCGAGTCPTRFTRRPVTTWSPCSRHSRPARPRCRRHLPRLRRRGTDEPDTRDLVTTNQGPAGKDGAALFPITAQELAQRNTRPRKPPTPSPSSST